MTETRRKLTIAIRPCEPPPDTIDPHGQPEMPVTARPNEVPTEEPSSMAPAPVFEQPPRSVPEIPAFGDDGR